MPTTSVPFVDLARQHTQLRMELHTTFHRVPGRGAFILGEEVEQFAAVAAARDRAARDFSLPIFPAMTAEQLDEVATAVETCMNDRAEPHRSASPAWGRQRTPWS
jgi:dTDP-4-amino-4,6-dideoxygalactose transaminase